MKPQHLGIILAIIGCIQALVIQNWLAATWAFIAGSWAIFWIIETQE